MADSSPLAFAQGLVKAAQEHPLTQNVHRAIQRFQDAHLQRDSAVRLPPRVVVLPRHPAVAAIIPGDSTVELVLTNGINNFLNLYNTALIVRLVLTWFPNPPEAIVSPLATVCDPYLNLFRGLIPPLGGTLDFSPILAFVVLNLFTNTAAALPCEVPRAAAPAAAPAAAAATSSLAQQASRWAHVTKGQAAFARRVAARRQWAAAASAAGTA